MSQQLMPEALLERVSRRFRILSETVRLQLLNQLQVNGEMCVQEIIAATGLQQALISFSPRRSTCRRRESMSL